MCTNTYAPHVGGVAQSVERFAAEFRRQGHRVLIVAPVFENTPENEADVVRFPAIQRFNGSDFSVPVPVPTGLSSAVKSFQPEIVHSHHPFLLGDTALRIAASLAVPLVFTHHTLYEQYTHYVPGDSRRLKRFVIDLVSGYCNLCEIVIAPSESVERILRQRGVEVPIEVIPTGLDPTCFANVDGEARRAALGIPADAFVVGHVGRLAPEKNLAFLAEALTKFLAINDGAHFLVAGEGPEKSVLLEKFGSRGLGSRVHMLGILGRMDLIGVYRMMDVFAFSSHSETQGMVLTEAMAAGVPVVALDAPGVREVIRDGINGRLLQDESTNAFTAALSWVAALDTQAYERLHDAAGKTALEFSIERVASKTFRVYQLLIDHAPQTKKIEGSPWAATRRLIREEWKIVRNIAHAAKDAVLTNPRAGDA